MVALSYKFRETNLGLASPEMNKAMDFLYVLEHLFDNNMKTKL